MRRFLIVVLVFCGLVSGHCTGKAKHVVVMVWDGMRPDFINPTNTPNLSAMAARGTFFGKNHPVYFSSTEVNGTALATGDYPRDSGVIANREFRPRIDPKSPVAMESLKTIRQGDQVTGGEYLRAPTVAEILQRAGLVTVVAGSKPVVLLQDREARPENAANIVLYEGQTLPENRTAGIYQQIGPFPPIKHNTKTDRDVWTARALTESLWETGVPTFSLLWMAEPDMSQHNYSPGSPEALAAIRNSDRQLGRVIQTLKDKGVFDDTDVFVVSDHGFSTIAATVNVAARLAENGFRAVRSKPQPGDVMVVGNGGSVLLYVEDHNPDVIGKLVRFLQKQDFVGVIFSKTPQTGTFPLRDALIDSADAPDVAFSMRWSARENPSGTPGCIVADAGDSPNMTETKLNHGQHVTLSRFDLHNTLVAAGPDIRSGFRNEYPSGNVDVAPTVLHILGVKSPKPMDGRVLREALVDGKSSESFSSPKTTRLEASAKLTDATWNQYLQRTEFGGVVYLDEGNGSSGGDEKPGSP